MNILNKKINARYTLLPTILVSFFILLGTIFASSYFTSGTLVSTDFLPADGGSVLNSFVYTVASLPAGTGIQVQFSQDNTNWYGSSGVLNAFDTLSSGTNTISLATLNWVGPHFYYKAVFSSDGVGTPLLDSVTLNYTASNYYWVGTAGGSWNNNANWSVISGGTGGMGVPGTGDTAIFDASNTNSANIDANLTVGAIRILTGYTGTVTQTSSYTIAVSGAFSQSAGTFTGGSGSISIAGAFTLSAGTFNAPSANLIVAGNWSNTGTFNAGSGMSPVVILNGTNQSISGNTTFNNFSKETSVADTLTFAAGSTQTLTSSTGRITLDGISGNLLSLRSSASPTKWNLNLGNFTAGTIRYVNVMDSDASGGRAITPTNGIDSGNNLNWNFDVTPPSITLATVLSPSTNNTPIIYGTSTDAAGTVSSVQFQMDGTSGSWIACTATDGSFNSATEAFTCSPSALADGTHTIYVISTDNSANVTANINAATRTFVVDTTAPVVSAGTDKAEKTLFTQNATANDVTSGISTYQWSKVTGPGTIIFGSATAKDTTVSADSEGTYVLKLTVTDNVGNSASSTFNLIWDTTSPLVSAGTDKNASSTFAQNATVTDALSGVATYQWSKVSGPGTITFGTPTSEDTTVGADTDGTYVVRLSVTDNAGNSASSTFNLLWDVTAPSVNAGTDKIEKSLFTQNATTSDATSGISTHQWSKVSGPGTITFGTPTLKDTTVSASIDGAYVLKLTVIDNVGNSASSTFNLIWDTTNPVVDAGTDKVENAVFTQLATTSDVTSGIATQEWSKVSGPGTITFGTPNAKDTTVSASLDGTYLLRLTVTDNVGNFETSDLTLTWDTVKPNTSDDYTVLKDGYWQKSDQTITLVPHDDFSGVASTKYCTSTVNTCSPSINYSVPVVISIDGTTYFRYASTDNAGNVQTTVSREVMIDKIAPIVSLTAPTEGSTVTGTSVSISATASDNVGISGVQFVLDSVTNIGAEDITSPYSIVWDSDDVSDGAHTLTAIASDAAGNYSTSTIVNINVHNNPPVRSNGAPSGTLPINTSSTTVSLNTDEAATCKYANSSTTPYSSMTSFTTTGGTTHSSVISGLSNAGSYIKYVNCRDTAGNTNNTEYTISFTVQADVNGPTVSITAPLNNAMVTGNSLAVTADATDDVSVSGVQFQLDGLNLGSEDTSAPYTIILDTTSIVDGYHTIKAVARDGSGNYSTSSTITITVDNTAPLVDVGPDKAKNSIFTQNSTTSDATSGTAARLWSKVSGPGTITFGTPTGDDTTIAADTDGTYIINLDVTDNVGNSASDTLALIWDTVSPVVDAGIDETQAATFMHYATATDALSGIASYSWAKLFGPGTVSFGSPDAKDTTVSANTAGTYVIGLTVTDNAGNSATTVFSLEWTGSSGGRRPVITPPAEPTPEPTPTPTPEPEVSTTTPPTEEVATTTATTTIVENVLPLGFCFEKNISQHTTDIDVKYLQIFLNDKGFSASTKGSETNYYGTETVNAVSSFQEHYASEILVPFGLTTGTGNFGTSTRLKANNILGCSPATIATTTEATTTPIYVESINKDLVILPEQFGTYIKNTDVGDVILQVPVSNVVSTTTFTITVEPLTSSNKYLVTVEAQLVNNTFYNITAADELGNAVHTFVSSNTLTLPIPPELSGVPNLGVYYLDEINKKWVLVTDTQFSDNHVTFQVNHLTKFAIFDTTKVPVIAEATSTESTSSENVIPVVTTEETQENSGTPVAGSGGVETIPTTLPIASAPSNNVISNIGESIQQTYTQTAVAVQESIQKAVVATEKTIQVTKEIVNTPAGSVITKTVSTAGVVAGAGASVSAIAFANPITLSEIWLIPAKLFGLLMGALGIRRKIRKWGTVYDSVTKRPLDPVYVSLINTETDKEVFGAITDLDGRYGFLALPGKYKILAHKTNYAEPSTKMKGKLFDEVYNDLYFGEEIIITQEGEMITKNIPMDPLAFDWNEFNKNKMHYNTFMKGKDIAQARISMFLFSVGALFSVISIIFAPAPYNFIIAGLYVLTYVLNYVVFKTKKSGTLTEKNTNAPLSFALIKIFREGETAPMTKKIADKFGKYYALVPKGKYYIIVDKKNEDDTYSEVLNTEVFDVENGLINISFIV